MTKLASHLCLFMLWLACASNAMAQRLVIDSPSPGPVTRVIYGKLTENSVFIFEKEYPLLRDVSGAFVDIPSDAPIASSGNNISSSTNASPAEASKQPILSIDGPRRTVLTSFTLPAEDMVRCANSPRFVGFKNLAAALKDKINSIVINSGVDNGPCSDKIAVILAKTLPDVKLLVESSSDEGIKIDLGVVSVGTAPKASDLAGNSETPPPAPFRSVADVIKMTQIKIGDQKITADANGWFVTEVPQQMEYSLEIFVRGYTPINQKVFALLLSAEVSPVSKGIGYYGRSAEFNKPQLAVKIIETPYLAKKITVDGGLGGGYGFGREVPGEKKGQRTVAGLGLERRDWYGALGYRGGIFYSRAPATVVPSTYTIRASTFYDGELMEGDLFARLGAGLELFHAKLTQPKKKIITASDVPTANIPQQVLAPMLTFSMHTVLFDRLIVSPSLVVTPLYIASIGLYTSSSPGLEISAKVFKNWIAALQLGTEVHRYPSQLGETRLQLDYGLLTFKRGVF